MARIRRFDIFAVFNMCKNFDEGMSESDSRAKAIWLAKHVASGKRSKRTSKQNAAKAASEKGQTETAEQPEGFFLSGVEQTEETYKKDIIRRFGEIGHAKIIKYVRLGTVIEGKKYEDIRDCEHKPHLRHTGFCEECSKKLLED